MLIEHYLGIVYVVGAVIGLVWAGYKTEPHRYDNDMLYMMALAWPLAIVCVVVFFVVMAPVKLGRFLKNKDFNFRKGISRVHHR